MGAAAVFFSAVHISSSHRGILTPVALHLIKLCVGADSIEDLADWQKKRAAERKKKGGKGDILLTHVFKMEHARDCAHPDNPATRIHVFEMGGKWATCEAACRRCSPISR